MAAGRHVERIRSQDGDAGGAASFAAAIRCYQRSMLVLDRILAAHGARIMV